MAFLRLVCSSEFDSHAHTGRAVPRHALTFHSFASDVFGLRESQEKLNSMNENLCRKNKQKMAAGNGRQEMGERMGKSVSENKENLKRNKKCKTAPKSLELPSYFLLCVYGNASSCCIYISHWPRKVDRHTGTYTARERDLKH